MYIPLRLLVALGVLNLLLLGGMGVLTLRAASRSPIEIVLPPAGAGALQELKVNVSGAVQVPGVYLLAPGDRVEDALRAAGGAAEDADLERLNLAARLSDADQVVVPRKGQISPGLPDGRPKVNINTASAAELGTLSGIGEVRSQQIVDSRTKEGLFLAPDDLVKRKIIPDSVYEKIKDQVVVK